MDDTPSKRHAKKEELDTPRPSIFGTPSRRATSAASAAIKGQSIDLTSEDEAVTPSNFNDEPLPIKMEDNRTIFGNPGPAFAFGTTEKAVPSPSQGYQATADDYQEGEI